MSQVSVIAYPSSCILRFQSSVSGFQYPVLGAQLLRFCHLRFGLTLTTLVYQTFYALLIVLSHPGIDLLVADAESLNSSSVVISMLDAVADNLNPFFVCCSPYFLQIAAWLPSPLNG